jgi:hypothetical protein
LKHLVDEIDEITLEDIENERKRYKAIEDKLKEVISALKASLRSFVPVILAVILGWASTGAAKEMIIRNITTQGRILAELGDNAPAGSIIYLIVAFLGIGILVGIFFNYKLKRLEMKDKMMDQSGIKWFKLGIGSWLLAALVGGVTWIYITKLVSESTFSPVGEKTLQRLYLAFTLIIGYFFGDGFNSVAIRLQVKKQRHQLKEKQVLDAIIKEFSPDELEHIIEQMEKPTFEGKITKEKARLLYDLLLRLKEILDENGVRNRLPGKFQGKNQIGGLLMLQEAYKLKVFSEKSPSGRTGPNDVGKSKKRPSTRLRWILLGGLGISLLMNQDLFGAVGEIIKSGQEAGLESSFGFPFGLGLWWGVLAFAVAIVGVRAIYQQVSLAGTGLVEVGRGRLPQVLGLEAVWQALVRLFEGGRGFVAAIFRKPSKTAELRMSWLGPQKEISQEKIKEIMELARRLLVKEGFQESPEISQLLGWTSLPEQMAGEAGRIEKFARMVRRRYERVVVIGEEARLYAKVAATIGERGYPEISVLESMRPEALKETMESEISPEKTLFVVSSADPVEYLYEKLTKFYEAQGIPAGEIASQVGKHFVAIVKANAPFAEEARKREFLGTFNVPEGISGSSAIFSEGALFILALAGVDIKGFVESGREGMEICREENAEKNLAIRLAAFQEVMRQAGREIVLVLPEELGGFGEVWQGMISPLGEEGKKIIVIGEEELAAGRRFGEKTAFIRLEVGRDKESLAIEQLRQAGYPVLEITLPGKESIGALSYVTGFATALSYLMEFGRFRKPGGARALLPAEAVASGLEKMSPVGAVGTEVTTAEAFLEHLGSLKTLKHKRTKVFIFDLESVLHIETVRKATASGMGIEFKVRPNGNDVFRFMGEIVDAAKQAGNLKGVKFAFVSKGRNLRKEVMERKLRDSMVENGLTNVVGSVIDEGLIIDGETEGIVDLLGRISAERVCSFITEKLLGRTAGNGIEFNIITADEGAWEKDDVDERMMKNILWMVLEPAKEGEVLSTAESLVVAIEGEASDWLKRFIRLRYPEDEAARVISEIENGDGRIVLPARAVDKDYLEEIEAQEKVYKCQA